jgi:flagellar secretion chaperone FliS
VSGTLAPSAYRESSVLTAPPERLVVMLYDGANRFLLQAAVAMRAGDLLEANGRMQRAEAILDELLITLDRSAGELADRLQAIYLFCKRLLGDARVERDPGHIEQARRLLAELRSSWAAISGAERGSERQ